ncbi:hypothetical protein B6U74_06185 [Candidatus Bathyarchaeota archaeon ex4484_205]|nr:MAG: hypothetical protein B6U74_06185 [Candidatus Bathyarchaeota archaeon ex4484_205]RLF90843.1 MAG: hypothetical protein DRN46_02710 [Thermococci archaeon]HDI10261.1 hypothetical protein [Euryarchaeota archaeon]
MPRCIECLHSAPHWIYEYFVLCTKKGKLIILAADDEDVECEYFEERSEGEVKRTISDRGWVYCLTCKRAILLPDELEEHLGHTLGLEGFPDEVVYEEARVAD